MEYLNPHDRISPDVVNEVVAPKKYDVRHIGSVQRRIDGGKIFVFSFETGSLKEAEFEQPKEFNVSGANNPKLMLLKNCAYVEALNLKNAKKRLYSGKIMFRTNP